MYDRTYQSPEFLAFLKNPDAVFTQPKTEVLKDGRSSTVVKIKLDGHSLVVKRYNIKGVWHWLRRCLRFSRAADCWRIANLLRLFGVATAKPVAYVEKQVLGFRGKSYFVMEYVKGKHIGDYFANYREQDSRLVKVAERVAALLKNLTRLRLSHGDLKMTNILICQEAPVLLDLDGVMEHRSKRETKRAYKKEVKRFMKNWESHPNVRELFERIMGV